MLRGKTGGIGGRRAGRLPFRALAQLVSECPIPPRFIEDHLDGFAIDEGRLAARNEDELGRYCYHVAGTVGSMMAIIMGVPPEDSETLERAADLGIHSSCRTLLATSARTSRAAVVICPQTAAGGRLGPTLLLDRANRGRLVTLLPAWSKPSNAMKRAQGVWTNCRSAREWRFSRPCASTGQSGDGLGRSAAPRGTIA